MQVEFYRDSPADVNMAEFAKAPLDSFHNSASSKMPDYESNYPEGFPRSGSSVLFSNSALHGLQGSHGRAMTPLWEEGSVVPLFGMAVELHQSKANGDKGPRVQLATEPMKCDIKIRLLPLEGTLHVPFVQRLLEFFKVEKEG